MDLLKGASPQCSLVTRSTNHRPSSLPPSRRCLPRFGEFFDGRLSSAWLGFFRSFPVTDVLAPVRCHFVDTEPRRLRLKS